MNANMIDKNKKIEPNDNSQENQEDQQKNDKDKDKDKDKGKFISIGEYLKGEREKRNFSLKKISSQTKIGITILENLESDHLDRLPNRAYIKGFIKSYAKVLNLKVNDCLEILDVTYATKFPNTTIENRNYEDSDKAKFSTLTLSLVGMLFIGIVLAVVFFYSYNSKIKEMVAGQSLEETIVPKIISETTPLNTQKISKTEAKELSEAKAAEAEKQAAIATEKLAQEKKIQEAAILAEKKLKAEESRLAAIAKRTQKARLAAQLAQKKEQEKQKTNDLITAKEKSQRLKEKKLAAKEERKQKKLTSIIKEKKIEFTPLSNNLYAIVENPTEVEMQYLPQKIKHSYYPGKQNIFINAFKGDTWITYKQDEKNIKKFVLKKGRTLLIRADESRIFLGNVNVTKIFLNNKPLKIIARKGVKSLVFPQENANKYKIPLFIYDDKNGTVQASSDYRGLETN